VEKSPILVFLELFGELHRMAVLKRTHGLAWL
jgi:hypothetical protein